MNVTIQSLKNTRRNNFTIKAESVEIISQSKNVVITGKEVLNTATSINEMIIPFENVFALCFTNKEVILSVDDDHFVRLKSVKDVFNQ
jgi:hypothetical protein